MDIDEETPPYYELQDEDSTAVPAATAMKMEDSELGDASEEYESRRLNKDGDMVVAVEPERIQQ